MHDLFDEIARHRTALLCNGYMPLAVYGADQAWLGTDAGRAPAGEDWADGARARARQRDWSEPVSAEASNTGILCDGLRVIEVDVEDPPLSGSVFDAMCHRLGHPKAVRFRENSLCFAAIYCAAEGSPPTRQVAHPELGRVDGIPAMLF